MRLMIVDDEPLIHQSIEFCLKELGCFDELTVLHAYNGSDMLRQLQSQPVDLALVDIRMPGVDGLEAIREAKVQWPATEYYIMSGFSEFEYAREAVHLSVTDYLMKPLSKEDLARVLQNLRAKRDEDLLRVKETFRTWLMGGLHRHDVDYLYTPGYFVGIILLTYDSPTAQEECWIPNLKALRENVLSLPCDEGLLLLAFSPAAGQVHAFINHLPKRDIPAGVTMFVSSVHDTSTAALAEMRVLLESSPLRVFHGTSIRYDARLLLPASEPELQGASCFLRLQSAWAKQDYQSFSKAHAVLRRSGHGLNDRQLQAGKAFVSLFLEDASGGLLETLSRAESTLLGKNKSIDRIDAIVDYIDDHFCEELSISALADQFGLTPNYLSSLLKSRKNIKFTDYLTSLRMKKAMELLLSTEDSVKEVSQQVGYHSQSHFTKLFIENQGCSPTEFKRKFWGSSEKE